jgi:DNA-binding NarL/FixJ family response regulator
MIRTLIVDDQNIIRKGIKVLLENSAEIELVGFAEDGESALNAIEATQPDVVLLDINLPGIDGITVANNIATKFPQIKVIMLSSYEDEHYVSLAMASNAKGYLLKNVSAEELEWSIKLVHQGYSAFKSELLTPLVPKDQETSLEPVSPVVSPPKTPVEKIPLIPVEKVLALPSPPKTPTGPDELELLLAKNHFRHNQATAKAQNKYSNFNDPRMSRTKKMLTSFEFRLLVLIILFSLSFLVFVALSYRR